MKPGKVGDRVKCVKRYFSFNVLGNTGTIKQRSNWGLCVQFDNLVEPGNRTLNMTDEGHDLWYYLEPLSNLALDIPTNSILLLTKGG